MKISDCTIYNKSRCLENLGTNFELNVVLLQDVTSPNTFQFPMERKTPSDSYFYMFELR